MQVIEWLKFLDTGLPLEGKFSSMTVGIFDGVHLGHQALLEKIVSHNANFVPVVVTFRQTHKTGNENTEQNNIQTFQQRLTIFENAGIQITIVIDFTETFMKMPGLEFLEILLKHGKVGFFAVGNNFRCGYRLDTDAAAVKNYFASRDIPVEIVPEVCYPADGIEDSVPISSSRIRAAISAGDFALAQVMLGGERHLART